MEMEMGFHGMGRTTNTQKIAQSEKQTCEGREGYWCTELS
jgi:hypothetical protein